MTARILAPFVPSWMAGASRQVPRLSHRTLPVKQITRRNLLRSPLEHPLRRHSLAVLLDWSERLDDDKAFLWSRIPWLSRLPLPWTALLELSRYGLMVLTADDHQLLSTLAAAVRVDERLSVQIFTWPWSPENG